MRDGELTWGPLDGDRDGEALAALAERCHAADGGIPQVTVSRFGADGVITTGARTAAGVLVAAAAVRRLSPGAAVIGLVDPAHRGRGVGGGLLDWGLAAASAVVSAQPVPTFTTAAPAVASAASAAGVASGPGVAPVASAAGVASASGVVSAAATVGAGVSVETEALTAEAERLFASRGLRKVFAEDVMRFDLAAAEPPHAPLPPGLVLREWTPDLAPRFFDTYDAAFRDRPGFPGWPAERWVAWTAGDEEFRPQWSLLATGATGADGADGADAGFVTCADGWIVQVGVVPAWRGRGVGGGLVAEALRRMRAGGAAQALLDVNVDSPAARLYARLGFTVLGRRAKFAAPPR